jgi:hypothetical protein
LARFLRENSLDPTKTWPRTGNINVEMGYDGYIRRVGLACIAQAQLLFEHAVYGEEGTNLRQLRRAGTVRRR